MKNSLKNSVGGINLRKQGRSMFTAVLAIILAATLLAACGGNGGGSSAETAASSNSGTQQNDSGTQADKKPEDYKGTITLWGWDTNYYEKTFAAFQKVYPNIKLEVTNVATADYVQKMQTTLASGGDLPDILASEMNFRARAYEMDVWENLEAPPYNFDRTAVFDYLPPLTSNSKGEIIGIEQTVTPAALAYRRDLAKTYFGTDDPKQLEAMLPTWDAFIEKGKEIKSKDGTFMLASLGDANQVLWGQSKTPIFDGKYVDVTGRMKDILTNIVKFRDAGIVDKLEQWSPQWNASYAGGKHIFYPAANWSPQYVIKTNDKDGEGRWGLMKPPGGTFTWGGTTYGITKQSKNKELAWKYIEWLLLTKEGAEASKSVGFYVPLKSVYEDPNFASSPDSFFGGQDIGSFWMNDVVPTIDTPKMSPYDTIVSDANALVINVLNANYKETADRALEKMISEVKAKLPEVEVK